MEKRPVDLITVDDDIVLSSEIDDLLQLLAFEDCPSRVLRVAITC